MLFSNPEYFLFLTVVLLLYYRLGLRLQNRMLLVASYIFYGAWDVRFLSLILLSTTVDYFVGQAIGRTAVGQKRRIYLSISLLVNLGILGFFKYFNFFIDNATRLLSAVGLEVSLPALSIILPVGVSFYTFQEIAYIVDVYRGRVKPVTNFWDYALFVAFFPQLMAGPISRAENLLPQLQNKRTVDTDKFVSGLTLILIGLFRKVVIADAVALRVDLVFARPQDFTSPELIMGVLLFAVQIYCDFAGYSDIARGSSRLLGIELIENFNQPYLSASITEFWRRWHISLSTWLRDYLYIPLGGNRRGTLKTYRNLMITMLLGGLWHGASWNFVVWGGLHGSYLIVDRLVSGRRVSQGLSVTPQLSLRRAPAILLTFLLVSFAWIFFRAPGLSAAIDYIRQIFAFQGMETWINVLPVIAVPWLLSLAIDIPQYITRNHVFILGWPRLWRDTGFAVLLFMVFLGIGTRAPFIYFQF